MNEDNRIPDSIDTQNFEQPEEKKKNSFFCKFNLKPLVYYDMIFSAIKKYSLLR